MSSNFNSDSYNSTALKDLAPEAASRVIARIKEDPFAILPINMFCAALDIKDPLTVIKNFEPDKEDVGIMVNACIGCIPVVGPLLQGFFSIFWKRAAESNVVTKEMLKEELDKFKKEMMEAVAGKIKESEAKQWTEICDAFLSGLKKSFKVLTININALKHQFAEKQDADEQVQEAVRINLELIRDKAMSLHEFCSSPDYLACTLPFYVQSLQIYTIVMTIMDSFWYQIGIKPLFVSGKPATDTIDAVPSFRERMHDEIIPALINIAKCIDASEQGKLDLSTVPFLLKSDRYLYPIPLIVAPVNIPSLIKTFSEIGTPSPTIELPENDSPYIYRIDCINFRPNASSEHIRGYRKMAETNEPISGCKGNINGIPAGLFVVVPKGKTVQVRVLGQYSKKLNNLPLSIVHGDNGQEYGNAGDLFAMMDSEYEGTSDGLASVQEPIGITNPPSSLRRYLSSGMVSGLTYTKPMVDVPSIEFTTHAFDDLVTVSRILFVELIVQNNN